MHETAVMKDLMSSIKKLMGENLLVSVKSVKVRIGALSPFSAEHFREYFYEAAAGSPVEQARLIVEASDDIAAADAQAVILDEIEGECAN